MDDIGGEVVKELSYQIGDTDYSSQITEFQGLDPQPDLLFVSSNPWDACGAKAFGLRVAWIERVTPEAMARECARTDLVAPLTMFKALRMQMDELGVEPDHRIASLSDLPKLVAAG